MGASSEIVKTVARIDVIVGAGLVKQLNSVSAICPMLYWGSFFEMCDCEQCYIWGSVKQCHTRQRTAGLDYIYRLADC